ncbi:TPA: 30S ribosomal protein S4 [Candidatus Latescibacteria bacterium]|nr:30S ribosomal protein S4 [Candidatus Latescibacterota bacterium]|tara:strand:+ start:41 stop:649 length:609 start_codon:yes stop_codon:yes gene_type:complete
MSRYTGPKVKKMRAVGVDLPGLSRKTIADRAYPPGQHGQTPRRKMSEYKMQLMEKQKIRMNYGLTEKQLRTLVKQARQSKVATGEKLIELLERRLDNVVFRGGFAPTIPAARQLVRHGHLLVNGMKVDIPSYQVDRGDVVTPREKSLRMPIIQETLPRPSLQRPGWLSFDAPNLSVSIIDLPSAEYLPFPFEVQLIIEYYAK